MLKTAAFLIGLSGLLHIVTLLFGQFPDETLILVAIGIVYFGLATAVAANRRWAAWLGFFFMLVGAIGALSATFNESAIPTVLFTAIALTDVLAALALFCALWVAHKPAYN